MYVAIVRRVERERDICYDTHMFLFNLTPPPEPLPPPLYGFSIPVYSERVKIEFIK